MKSKLLTAVILLYSILSFAQNEKKEHLVFKGVPIDGTLSQYMLKMTQSGFTHVQTENGMGLLKGDFAGYKDCIVGVSTLKNKDLVHKIAVIFKEQETWSALSGNYLNLKDLLTEKYGQPTNVVEKFEGGSEPKTDDSRMYKVQFDNCKYYSTWKTDKGNIEVSIEHDGVIRCFVSMRYIDKINSEIIRAKAKDDL
jgi:hypothetical protein